jgi:hypothetical protein
MMYMYEYLTLQELVLYSSEVSNLKISKLELIVVQSVPSTVSFTSAAAIGVTL